ncbi:MAG: 4-hydroxythreonine-4-phosphate dehydrogenase PdxA [Proteobacteria bacterium]|nr:4-hydroxythreonine-4-phosphate dehydrogenase PdxA [Pseudomonadota bacterium]MCP4921781.1 4-hydroxythreonine-4-phosphate dehydrogenase PdxA [Pseudomonadota bacterium]
MLVVTPGDPAGVGPEVTAKALDQLDIDAVVVGDQTAFSRWSGRPVVEPPAGDEPVEVRALRFAVAGCLDGRFTAMVTGPIHKARLAARGFHHAGHTGFLGELCSASPVMAFTGGDLRVALVTTHIPLSAVSQAITSERLAHVFDVASAELRGRLDLVGRLLVCGLNPHAGDGGVLGREEIDVIEPAIAAARARGLHVEGPVSAEAAFRRMRAGHADMVVAMYHDQGLAPLKLVDFGRSVNWTLGLPIVRTSVDHGTADDIAGQGIADAASMVAAIRLAQRLG